VNTPAEEAAKGYKRDLTYTLSHTGSAGYLSGESGPQRMKEVDSSAAAQQWIENSGSFQRKTFHEQLLLGERPETSLAAGFQPTLRIRQIRVGLSISHRFRNIHIFVSCLCLQRGAFYN